MQRLKEGSIAMTRIGAALALGVAVVSLGSTASAEPWASESGMHGAGLGMSPPQFGRVWADVAFFTRAGETQNLGPITLQRSGFTYLSPIFGLGLEVGTNMELDGILPVAAALGDNGATVLGNPYVGLSYVGDGPAVRLKVGGGIAIPVVNTNNLDANDQFALGAGIAPRAFQGAWLWIPDSLSIVAPLHIEAPLGTPVLFMGDAAMGFAIPVRNTDTNETNLYLELAPGFAAHASDNVVLGLRFPLFAQLTNAHGDSSQMSLEPFIRFNSDALFLSIRFTMPIDDPLGFAFDTGKYWGLHVGLGAAF